MAKIRITTKTRPAPRTAFKKGHPKYGGRKGNGQSPNILTPDLRSHILNALNRMGGEAWLRRLAAREPKAMAGLLRAIIPQRTIEGPDPSETAAEIRKQLRAMDDATMGKAK